MFLKILYLDGRGFRGGQPIFNALFFTGLGKNSNLMREVCIRFLVIIYNVSIDGFCKIIRLI